MAPLKPHYEERNSFTSLLQIRKHISRFFEKFDTNKKKSQRHAMAPPLINY